MSTSLLRFLPLPLCMLACAVPLDEEASATRDAVTSFDVNAPLTAENVTRLQGNVHLPIDFTYSPYASDSAIARGATHSSSNFIEGRPSDELLPVRRTVGCSVARDRAGRVERTAPYDFVKLVTEHHRSRNLSVLQISLVFEPNPEGLKEVRCLKWTSPNDASAAITIAEVRDALGNEKTGTYVQIAPPVPQNPPARP